MGFSPDRVSVVRPGIPYLAEREGHKATNEERHAAREVPGDQIDTDDQHHDESESGADSGDHHDPCLTHRQPPLTAPLADRLHAHGLNLDWVADGRPGAVALARLAHTS